MVALQGAGRIFYLNISKASGDTAVHTTCVAFPAVGLRGGSSPRHSTVCSRNTRPVCHLLRVLSSERRVVLGACRIHTQSKDTTSIAPRRHRFSLQTEILPVRQLGSHCVWEKR